MGVHITFHSLGESQHKKGTLRMRQNFENLSIVLLVHNFVNVSDENETKRTGFLCHIITKRSRKSAKIREENPLPRNKDHSTTTYTLHITTKKSANTISYSNKRAKVIRNLFAICSILYPGLGSFESWKTETTHKTFSRA